MKRLRPLLLILRALPLPVRGAIGAAMLCPQSGHGAVSAHQHDHHHGDVAAAADTHSSSCQLCAAFCSMTPMPNEDMPALSQAAISSTLSFPLLRAPSPTFQSDEPERPPRSS